MSGVVIFGGYGTFGSLVARTLVGWGVPVVIAGRDASRASTFARTLGPGISGLAADVSCRDSCRQALQGQRVAVNCAGPFSVLGPALLDASLDLGCHHVDLADDRRYTALVRSYAERFRQRGLTGVFGASSVPGISGALALLLRSRASVPLQRARVTLFVGNDNAKGSGAIRSVVEQLGKPIQTPQGTVRGFGDREVVPLPQPFGRRAVFNFDSPEYDLFPTLLGVPSVSVKIGLELRLATQALALLATLSSRYGRRTVAFLEWMGRWTRGLGSSGGVVMTELFDAAGGAWRAALLARSNGQRMAALPCALAARALVEAGDRVPGVLPAYEFLGAARLLECLVDEGFLLEQHPVG